MSENPEQKILRNQLLNLFYSNSRYSSEEIAELLNKSRQTISKIRQDLWLKKIISTPTLLLNPHSLNLQYFFMEIKTNPAEPQLLEYLKKIPNIQSIDGILGEYALIVQFEVRTKQKFADILSSIEKNMVQTLFQSYRIIETIDVYKLGGVILKRDVELAQVDDKRWQLLNLLRKNNNFRKWENRVDHEFFSEEDESFINKINLSREYETFNDQKIIQRFTITIDHPMPDFKTKFYMRIKPKQVGQYTQLAQQLMYEPNIHSLYRTGEDAGLLAILRTKDLRDFKDLIYRLYQTYEIRDTFTTVVVDEHLPSIYPPTMEASKKECVKR